MFLRGPIVKQFFFIALVFPCPHTLCQTGLQIFNTSLSVTENKDHTECLDFYNLVSLVDLGGGGGGSGLDPSVTAIYHMDHMG